MVSPSNQSSFQVGSSILFEGTASDDNIDSMDLQVFASDIDGDLGDATINSSGEINFVSTNLSNNAHVISMTVSDEVVQLLRYCSCVCGYTTDR